ncbi:hypothetical protein EVAR_31605_1 [Eumeta japonica]|uniref:Uncharacterized protein n=1 Tax=Eumeta variegata TaxID=151549 RepID=A0A4C1VZA6_EUMVA|nr:hypothetical protein EVAR_31605_1 [Eumeta japonica]
MFEHSSEEAEEAAILLPVGPPAPSRLSGACQPPAANGIDIVSATVSSNVSYFATSRSVASAKVQSPSTKVGRGRLLSGLSVSGAPRDLGLVRRSLARLFTCVSYHMYDTSKVLRSSEFPHTAQSKRLQFNLYSHTVSYPERRVGVGARLDNEWLPNINVNRSVGAPVRAALVGQRLRPPLAALRTPAGEDKGREGNFHRSRPPRRAALLMGR